MSEPTVEALQAENAALRQRILDVEGQRNRLQQILQTTLDHVDSVIYIRDLDGTFRLLNTTYEQSLNVQAEDFLGKRDADVFPQQVWEAFRANDRLAMQRGGVIEKEEFVPLPDGLHTYRSLKFPVFDEQGQIHTLVGISTDVTRQKRDEAALRESQTLLEAIFDNASMILYTKDRAGRYVLVSRGAAEQLALTRAEVAGKTDHDFMNAAAAEQISINEQRLFTDGNPQSLEEVIPLADGPRTYINNKFPLRNAAGEIHALCGIATDITLLKRGEEDRRRLQEDVIAAQERALRELSTPLIPIAEGVVAMPLIGTIDERRAAQIMETLLTGVKEHRARIAILDLTGVQNVDTRVTNGLVQAIQAVQLLGAETVITGIQPQMARTMVTLDVPMDRLHAQATFQGGIEYALAQHKSRRPRTAG